MTTLREVAKEAGISIGAVQHHYGTKGHLIDAVEAYVRDIMHELFSPTPSTTSGAAPIEASGETVKRLIVDYPFVAGYVARAMVDNTAFGASIFDGLVELGEQRWQDRADEGLLADDVDLLFANVNTVLLGAAGVIFRAQIDRYLSGTFNSTQTVSRWVESVNTLIRKTYLKGDV
ncbi:TetR/AcrR family transcriptional regulator [Mycolicibacterium psychrotolerans]|uniref:TetR/AcrR family transcriptional regulator n=1 Tax=Mycolicibacterium psychrotolerans TaxID=216929 RepID=UPI003D66D52E